HHSWTPDEIRQYEQRHPIGSIARLALALLLETGQRRSDVVKLGPQNEDSGWLTFTQTKNHVRKPITLSIPISSCLRTVIEQTPCGSKTYLVTKLGWPFTAAGFGNKMREWC